MVFKANPWIDGISYLPKDILGDDQDKDDNELKPQIYLTELERARCQKFVFNHTFSENFQKPLCLIHAWDRQNEKTKRSIG